MLPLKWGFFGAGRITSDFVRILASLSGTSHVPYGVASRDHHKAKLFAEQHGVLKSYSNYVQLVEDPEIDVVYIGTVNSEHFYQAKLAVCHGKHVLVEKSICVNYKQCKQLMEEARRNKVFLMEGFWTLCFPATQTIMKEIRNGAIGEIVTVSLEVGRGGDFGRMERFRSKQLGGGILLNHGVYGLMLSYVLLGYPSGITATAHLSPEGLDETVTVTLSYNNPACLSNIIMSCRSNLESTWRVSGTSGIAMLPCPFWAPNKVVLPAGEEVFEHPKIDGLNNAAFNYPYASGFVYEIEEVAKCIREGKLESEFVPWEASLNVMRIADEIRSKIGVHLPQDDTYESFVSLSY